MKPKVRCSNTTIASKDTYAKHTKVHSEICTNAECIHKLDGSTVTLKVVWAAFSFDIYT